MITNRAGFDAVNVYNTDYLMGMFEPKRMLEETIRQKDNSEPSIEDMVTKAIGILGRNPNGFYLFVEGQILLLCFPCANFG